MVNSVKVNERIKAGLEQLREQDVVSKALQIKNDLESKPVSEWNVDYLVDRVLTLCYLMTNLGEMKDLAYARAENMAEEYKSKVNDIYLEKKASEKKMTDKQSEAEAKQECDELKEEELILSFQARWLKSLYDNCDRIVSFTQTKVKSYKDEEIRSNIQRL
jgi:hypothetical protein